MVNVSLPVPANQSVSRVLFLNPFYQATDATIGANPYVMPCGITTSPAWQAFSTVYEDVRLVGVRYAIQMRSTIPTDFPQVTFSTAWRRNFPASNLGAQIFPAEVTESASAMQVSAINNTVNKLIRSCYPSDLMERIDFHNAETSVHNLPYYVQGTTGTQQGAFSMIEDQFNDQSEPHPTFSPTLLLCCNVHDATTAARILELTVTCYATVEFRGPKFGTSGLYPPPSKGNVLIGEGDLPPDNAPDVRMAPVIDAVMDDGDGDDGPAVAAAAAVYPADEGPDVDHGIRTGRRKRADTLPPDGEASSKRARQSKNARIGL